MVWNIFHILGISSSQLTFIFFRGVETTNQLWYNILFIYNTDCPTYYMMIDKRLTIGNDELCFRNPRAGEKRRSSSLVFSSPCGGTGSSLWVNLGRRCSATAPILPRALGRVRPGRFLEVYWATGSIWRLQKTLRQPEVTARKLGVLCIERMSVSLVKLGVCNEYHRSIIGLVGTGNPVLTVGKKTCFSRFSQQIHGVPDIR